MAAYYNEIDPHAADWLRNLISAGFIPAGDVDTRSVGDVRPDDLRGYIQCHFFAGIGGWPYALRLAGWPDHRQVWTGSCPCQPWSSAARGRNQRSEDARDLWPAWLALIAARTPRVIFGEQVANGSEWIDRSSDGLEALGYEIGAAVLPAVSVGKDHARPRLYFVGHANGDRKPELRIDGEMAGVQWDRSLAGSVVPEDGVSARVAALAAFGNAVVPQLAAEFIMAYTETL